MSNKDRLYVCLYARGGQAKMPGLEDTYHWALLVGPKTERDQSRGLRYHAKESITPQGVEWTFQKVETSLHSTAMLLIRVVVGKVEDAARLDLILRQVPVREDDVGWNCVTWVRDALTALEKDGKALGTSQTNWNKVRQVAMTYCEQKKKRGRFQPGDYDPRKVPTYDLMDQKETVA